MPDDHCDRPPAGWACTRSAGHDGPCAAVSQGGEARNHDEILAAWRLLDEAKSDGWKEEWCREHCRSRITTGYGHRDDCPVLLAFLRVRSSGGEARNHEAEVEVVARALDHWVLGGEDLNLRAAQDAIAALDAVRRSPKGEDHDIRREISKNAPLRERIADELAHNDECGSGPVSWQEYLADADAILRIVGEHGPEGDDHETGIDTANLPDALNDAIFDAYAGGSHGEGWTFLGDPIEKSEMVARILEDPDKMRHIGRIHKAAMAALAGFSADAWKPREER